MDLNFNEELEIWMKRNGISKIWLADKLGITRQSIYNRIKMPHRWTEEEIEKLDDMGMDITKLVSE